MLRSVAKNQVNEIGFSIILISFRHDEYFKDALLSIEKQSFDHSRMQLLVVCKSYGSPLKAIEAADIDFEVVIITDDDYRIGPKIDSAVSKAKYDWIAILDDDDFWSYSKLERLNRIIEADPNAAYIHNEKYFVDQHMRDEYVRDLKRGSQVMQHTIKAGNKLNCEHNESSITFWKDIVKGYEVVLKNLEGGLDTFIYVCAKISMGEVYCIPDKLTYFYVNDYSKNGRDHTPLISNLNRQLQSYGSILGILPLGNNLRKYLQYLTMTNSLKVAVLGHKYGDVNTKISLIGRAIKLKLYLKPEAFVLLCLVVLSLFMPSSSEKLYFSFRKKIKFT